MTIAELIMEDARARNLRHFFGIPGGGSPLDLMEAAPQPGRGLRQREPRVLGRHHGRLLRPDEGYGRAGALTIRGVGAANLVGGAANIHFERAPMVAVCETCPPATAGYEMVQHCDQLSLFSGIERYGQTLSPENAPLAVQEASYHATEGRPGPALLNFPPPTWAARNAVRRCPPRAHAPAPPAPEHEIAACRELLSKWRRWPVVIAGADVVRDEATGELLSLVENLGAAVLVTMEARGVFPESHDRWAGVFAGIYSPGIIESRVFEKADGVLLLGVDSLMTHAPWKCDLPTAEVLSRPEYRPLSQQPKVRVNGNLKSVLPALAPQECSGFHSREVQALRQEVLPAFKRPGPAKLAAQDIIEICRKVLPSDGILISETGVFICMLEHLWQVDQPGTYYGTSGGRTMGLTLPAICGARLADPERPMIGLGADGSLLMRLGELEVLARTGGTVPLVIVNDQALGTMKARQKLRNMPDYGLDLHPVQFADVARACGLKAATVDTPEDFERELRAAMTAGCADADRRQGGPSDLPGQLWPYRGDGLRGGVRQTCRGHPFPSRGFSPQHTRFRPEFLDFRRGIRVGNLNDDERITRILKVALEARYRQPFVTERWGRGGLLAVDRLPGQSQSGRQAPFLQGQLRLLQVLPDDRYR